MSQLNLELSCAEGASQGARNYQEDSLKVWRPETGAGPNKERPILAVLADGMGGHVSGEVASRTACDSYVQAFNTRNGPIDQRLDEALSAANAALAKAIAEKSTLNGMGCTLVAGYVDHSGLRWASVGDSAILLYRAPNLYRLNEDHSLGAMLDKQVEHGVLTEEEARSDPRRRTLRSALTGSPLPLRQLRGQPYPLYPGDWLIMASDGLETLSGNDIAAVVSGNDNAEPREVVTRLLQAVDGQKMQHQDNTTIVAIRVREQARDAHSLPTRTVTRDAALEQALEKDVVQIGSIIPGGKKSTARYGGPGIKAVARQRQKTSSMAAMLIGTVGLVVLVACGVLAYIAFVPSTTAVNATIATDGKAAKPVPETQTVPVAVPVAVPAVVPSATTATGEANPRSQDGQIVQPTTDEQKKQTDLPGKNSETQK